MSVEKKTTVSDYIKAMFKMADNMEQPCEQAERQRVLVAANELKAAWERERVEIAARAATDAVNLTNKKWMRDFANVAKLREALEFIKQYFDKIDPYNPNTYTFSQIEVEQIGKTINAALASPPRNCDVWGAKEQAVRKAEYCLRYAPFADSNCDACPLRNYNRAQPEREVGYSCDLAWAQLPYEAAQEGGSNNV